MTEILGQRQRARFGDQEPVYESRPRHHQLRPLKPRNSNNEDATTLEPPKEDVAAQDYGLVCASNTSDPAYTVDPAFSDLCEGLTMGGMTALAASPSSHVHGMVDNSILEAIDSFEPSSHNPGSVTSGPTLAPACRVSQTTNASEYPAQNNFFHSTTTSPTTVDAHWGLQSCTDMLGEPDPDPGVNILFHSNNIPGFQDLVSATTKFIYPNLVSSHFPDLYINLLDCSQTATLLAYFQNARCLGLEIQEILNHKSPFYRPDTTMTDDPQTLLAMARKPWIPINLQPTLPQILIPHHPYLDLLPFPTLRARAITLAATMPRLFDPMELKRDIFKEGLFCIYRGSQIQQPSDARNWQAAPWFVAKWKLLLD